MTPTWDLACNPGMCPRLGIKPAISRLALNPLSHISRAELFFHLGHISLSWCTFYIVRALGIHQGGATLFAALWLCLWGRSQRGSNAACSLCSSPTFRWTLLWDWEFLSTSQPLVAYFTTRGFESFISRWTSPSSPARSTTLRWVNLAAHLFPLLPVWMNVSLTPWLSDFHALWYSGSYGCLLFLKWLLSLFWLCEEAEDFYLCLHLGQNSSGFLSICP